MKTSTTSADTTRSSGAAHAAPDGRLRGRLTRIGRGAAVFAFWLLVWQLLSMLVGLELLVPSPLVTLRTWWGLAGTSAFWLSALATLARVLAGFAAGCLLGAVCGFLTHYVRPAGWLLPPLLRVIRAVPVASFIILALVWVQTEALPAFIAAAMALPMVWQNVDGALGEVDPPLLEMARIYGFSRGKRFRFVVLPSIFPTFLSGAVSALGFAWKSGVAAEVICQPRLSIGRALQTAKVTLETPEVFAWTLTVCVLSAAFEKLLSSVSRQKNAARPGFDRSDAERNGK